MDLHIGLSYSLKKEGNLQNVERKKRKKLAFPSLFTGFEGQVHGPIFQVESLRHQKQPDLPKITQTPALCSSKP